MRIKTPPEAAAEVFYFNMLRSYLLRKSDLMKNYEMLLDHYNKEPGSFKVLTKNDLLRLKGIQNDIKNKKYSLFSGDLDFSSDISEIKTTKKSDRGHAEICDGLISSKETLLKITKNPISSVSREFPSMYGPIDIILQSEEVLYILEVKTDRADHAIIGQLSKYFVGMSLKLILRHFDEIRMVSICPGYDKASLAGLRQIGAQPYILDIKSLEIQELG